MHFVHIIEINDPRNPLLAMFTLGQVWRGLLRRVERPMDFLPQLNRCHIVLRGDRTLVRELDFGAFVVRDRVRLTPQREITLDTDSAPNIFTARLTISVEQPSEHHLQLRFTYDVQRQRADDAEMEAQYDRYLQAAYLQADIESVKIMRMLLAEGAL
jgi:Domain of unknown function (DUF1857)